MPKSIGPALENWITVCALSNHSVHSGHKGGAHEHPFETENDKQDTPWSCGPDGHVQTEAIR